MWTDWTEVGRDAADQFLDEDNADPTDSPSESDVQAALDEGLVVFSKIWGVVVSVAGGIARLASGEEVPVSELGPTTAGGEELPPETWVPGVPNIAIIGIGAIVLIAGIKYL